MNFIKLTCADASDWILVNFDLIERIAERRERGAVIGSQIETKTTIWDVKETPDEIVELLRAKRISSN